MGSQHYIKLSALNDLIHDTINLRFEGQRFWVLTSSESTKHLEVIKVRILTYREISLK